MAYLSDSQLQAMGFKSLGKEVKISDRASIYNADQIEIGDYSRIDDFCVLSGKLKFGRNVHIAPHCLLAGGEKGISMKDFSGLAYFVQVFSQSDDYTGNYMTNPTIPSEFKREKKSPVYIGKHVIVGAGSIIFPGVRVEDGCSVGASSVINRPTKPWGIYVGNPAKRIRERKQKIIILEKKFLDSEQPIE